MNGESRFGSGDYVGEACGTAGPNVVGSADYNTCSYRRKAYCNGSHAYCVDVCEMSFGYDDGKDKL